ncbi:cyclic-di-AMP-binding protein CbpB [Halalkalibacillus halophilus]|uniref:cyclic-di-AMP-binding protein CbpB n=1 Tax=Halalkalibacillus halophilus TaxID=392827 RepID=UPI00040E9825|nr:cyclic-di-AMP-binding protein CbpB [Halalkalibacillus halophilus]
MLDTESFHLETTLVKEMMIDADKVAQVQLSNPLEHALLVLTKTGYNAVPVSNFEGKFEGIISKSNIVEAMFGLEQIEVERLQNHLVEDVMNKKVPTLQYDDIMEKALHTLIDYNFVCVVNDEEELMGIITRRQLLKQFRNKYYLDQGKNI